MTQETHDDLAVLAWRYGAVVGIIDFDAVDLTPEEIEADRLRWPHIYRLVDGMPEFNDHEGAAYMAEISGEPFDDCLKVLLEEWPPPED